jgi:hypothetical protein
MGSFMHDRRPGVPAAEIATSLYQIPVAPEGEAGALIPRRHAPGTEPEAYGRAMTRFGMVIVIGMLICITGCASNRPVYRTAQTRDKSDAEMRADWAACQPGPDGFLFGPAIIVAPLAIAVQTAREVALRQCMEGKGYAFGELPPQPIKRDEGR